ncbi:MAG: LacI family DNA-binding transcriptional regulator [Eubacteriales bacterium]|nr:LacI family DNA-binding transcriptional regulator [Eubacteriales bacterium]
MKKKKISITQIANDLGIAPSTVSRALNDLPGVGEELRAQIKTYTQQSGYFDKTMKSASGKKLNIIAMIVGDIRNPFYADLVFNVQKELNKHGYLLSVFNSEYDEKEELNYMRIAELFNFSGIIQVTVTTEQMSNELKNLSIPVVMVNRMISSFETDVVLLDNYEAGYIATRYLVELGHSRIGFLLGQKESSSSRQRYDGYLQAMKNYNLEVDERDILQGDLTMETAYALAKDFVVDIKDRPTAMIISNDLAAHGFMTCCQEAGVEIPKMLSVVSFDNIRFSSAGSIPLTTIDPHVSDMGRIAANLMVERIKNPNKEKERVILNPILLERKSTTPFRETKRD